MLVRHCSVSRRVPPAHCLVCRVRSAVPKEKENNAIAQNTTTHETSSITREAYIADPFVLWCYENPTGFINEEMCKERCYMISNSQKEWFAPRWDSAPPHLILLPPGPPSLKGKQSSHLLLPWQWVLVPWMIFSSLFKDELCAQFLFLDFNPISHHQFHFFFAE